MKGFPIKDGFKFQLGGETVTVQNGELFLENHKESVFSQLLKATGQEKLYEGDLKLKYDSFGNPLPWEFQKVKVDDLERHEALALGVFGEWQALQPHADMNEAELSEFTKRKLVRFAKETFGIDLNEDLAKPILIAEIMSAKMRDSE